MSEDHDRQQRETDSQRHADQIKEERDRLSKQIEDATPKRDSGDAKRSPDQLPKGTDKGKRENVADKGRDAKDHPGLSVVERQERKSQSTLTDRVPFPFGGKDTTLAPIERVFANMSAADRAALKNPASTLYLLSTASRVGTPAANLVLSQERGDGVQALIEADRERLQIAARIEVVARGQSKAAEEGRPSDRDNRDDRSVQFWVQGHAVESDRAPLSEADAVKMAEKYLDKAGQIDHSKVDVVKELFERGKVVGKEVLEGIKDLEKGDYFKIVRKVAELQAKTVIHSEVHMHLAGNVSSNLIPAFHRRLDELTIGRHEHDAPLVMNREELYKPHLREAALVAVSAGTHLADRVSSPELKEAMKNDEDRKRLNHAFDQALLRRLER